MDRLRTYITNQNYKIINYTSKIKTDFDLIEIFDRACQDKYKNVVFYLEVIKLSKDIIKTLTNSGAIPRIINNELVFLINSDNYIYINLSHDYNDVNIKKFLSNDDDDNKCLICHEQNKKFILCNNCSAVYCKDCIKKINNIKCSVCRRDFIDFVEMKIN